MALPTVGSTAPSRFFCRREYQDASSDTPSGLSTTWRRGFLLTVRGSKGRSQIFPSSATAQLRQRSFHDPVGSSDGGEQLLRDPVEQIVKQLGGEMTGAEPDGFMHYGR